jgi:hypothetical protein
MLGYLSHVHRVPYFTLQEGLYYADLHYYRFHTDFSTACMVWGEDCRDILLKAGCSDDKIYPLGNTHLWAAKQEFTDPATVERTRKRFVEAGVEAALTERPRPGGKPKLDGKAEALCCRRDCIV